MKKRLVNYLSRKIGGDQCGDGLLHGRVPASFGEVLFLF